MSAVQSVSLGLLLFVGCGGGSPAGPSGPPTTVPSISGAADGITGRPVQASISTSASGATARAAGYLPRETRQQSGLLYLWPAADTSEEDYIRLMLYTWTPLLMRWHDDALIAFELGAGLAGDPRSEAQLDRLVSYLASLPSVGARRGPGGVVLQVGPTDGRNIAQTSLTVSSEGTITGARINFTSRAAFLGGGGAQPNVVLHEAGHALGLWHSDRSSDVMHVGQRTQEWAFSGDERALLVMSYVRRGPGNRFPDRDAGLSTSSGTRTVAVSCE